MVLETPGIRSNVFRGLSYPGVQRGAEYIVLFRCHSVSADHSIFEAITSVVTCQGPRPGGLAYWLYTGLRVDYRRACLFTILPLYLYVLVLILRALDVDCSTTVCTTGGVACVAAYWLTD